MKSLITRTISGLIIVLCTIFITSRGDTSISYFILLLSVIGIKEFYDAVEQIGLKPIRAVGYLGCVSFLLNSLGYVGISLRLIFFYLIVILLIVLIFKKSTNLNDISITLLGICYIPFLMQHIIYLGGYIYVWLVFITAWGTDTCAYVFGNIFGKNKLCPKISPNKTIEGSLGGIFGSVLLTLFFVKYFNLYPLWKLIILAAIGGIIAQIGDLAASKIKRVTGIKDFGFIMPGHGGILDRFDSILFTAPFVYYFITCFIL